MKIDWKIAILSPLITCLVVSTSHVISAFAEGAAIGITSIQGGQDINGGTYVLGWKFRPSTAITVFKLGFYDDLANGLAASHDVGIYDSGCNLVASATIAPSDTLSGFFHFHDITPVVLTAGETYSIVGVTNNGDKYLYNPSSIQVDSSIDYIGFAQYGISGFPLTSAVLRCANDTSNTFFYGDFGPNFYISAGDGGQGGSNKRTTALTIFCNRTGPGLSIAKCTATVADQGEPPRSLPTGTIDWEATGGFSPSLAQCTPTQVSNSPGIGSCNVEFTIPDGFSIGTKFPINASYSGDATFGVSSTSHKLIVAACADSSGIPCPNAVGLSFDQYPQVLQDKIREIISCGATSTRSLHLRDGTTAGGTCTVKTSADFNAGNFFKGLTFDDAVKIGDIIPANDAERDTMLYLLKHAHDIDKERWKVMQETQEQIFKLTEDINTNRASVRKDSNPWEAYIRSVPPLRAKSSKPPFDKKLKGDVVEKEIKADKSAIVTVKVSKRVKTLVSYLKKAGVTQLPLTINMTAKQKKRRGTAKISENVNFIVK